MITVAYTVFTPSGSSQRYVSIDGTFMSVTAGEKGDPILNVFTDEDEDEILAVFRVWDWAKLETSDEPDPGRSEDEPEQSNVVPIRIAQHGGPVVMSEDGMSWRAAN